MSPPLYSHVARSSRPNSSLQVTPKKTLTIGLVNNMTGLAVRGTTKQFHDLVMEAAADIPVSLKVFTPFAQPRHKPAQASLADRYIDLTSLWSAKLDGMIVTGTEPKSVSLLEEPSWPFFERLTKWAERHVSSVVWSCMATQAAVFFLDGIMREPLNTKLSGIFECRRFKPHPLLAGSPPHWVAPHSRYNDLPEHRLVSCGYEILARSEVAGADIFAKTLSCQHFFLQGHMEYDAETLSREYRRDVRRFLQGETNRYPEMPSHYFSPDDVAAFAEFRKLATSRRASLFMDFPKCSMPATAPWRQVAVMFYRNWLSQLANNADWFGERESTSLPSTALGYDRYF